MAQWVIFGCGYVGGRLARALLADGEQVRACSRNVKQKQAALGELGAELHQMDASKTFAFGPALAGKKSPIVVYAIPPVPGSVAGQAVGRAAEAAYNAGASNFVFLSSTAVYGEAREGDVVDEDTAVATSDQDAVQYIREELALDGVRLTGLPTVVLRLTAVYGPGRGVRVRLRKGNYTLVDDGRHVYSRVHVDDVVGIIRVAVERAQTGSIYCVSDDRPTTQKEYADWLTARLGTPPPPSKPSLAPGEPRIAIRNRYVKNDRLKAELGYTFRYPTYVEGETAIESENG